MQVFVEPVQLRAFLLAEFVAYGQGDQPARWVALSCRNILENSTDFRVRPPRLQFNASKVTSVTIALTKEIVTNGVWRGRNGFLVLLPRLLPA
jgi:hypothetical protein